MNRLAVGSVWQSMYFLGLGMSDLQSLAENWMEWVCWFMNGVRRGRQKTWLKWMMMHWKQNEQETTFHYFNRAKSGCPQKI